MKRDPLVKKSSVSETKKKAITLSTSTQPKQKYHKKQTPTECTGDNKTIASMFDVMKRTLTPDKKADATRNHQKVQRNEDKYES